MLEMLVLLFIIHFEFNFYNLYQNGGTLCEE